MDKLAIFDFDGTLFPHETIPFLVKQYRKLGYGTDKVIRLYLKLVPLVIKYKIIKSLDKEEFRKSAVYCFLGLFENMTEHDVNGFFTKNVQFVLEHLDEEVVLKMKNLKEQGYKTVLLSGCFLGLLEPVGKQLEFDHIIGTKLCYKDNSIYDGEQVVDIIAGNRKASALTENFPLADLNSSMAYADSYYDKAILDLVGNKIAVNPDRQLEIIAKKNRWTIMNTKYSD